MTEELDRVQLVEAADALADLVEDWERRAKQAQADFENYKKEQAERRERWRAKAKQDITADLLPVLDNLERAIDAADDDNPLRSGVEMVRDQAIEVLEQHGVERVEPDSVFDPRLHAAVDTTPEAAPDEVVSVQRPGYVYEDTVIREADVVVGSDDDADAGDSHG